MAAEVSKPLKLMVIGDGGVGKSCFITRLVEGEYKTDHPPSQWKREQRFQRQQHQVVIDGATVHLEIMELNDELFRLTDVSTEAIYPHAMIADCYIYLFNLASKESLHSVGNWKHEMERYNVGPHRKHSVWMMAGHKVTDQDYDGFISQAEAKAAAMKMKFMAVNARDGENVEQSVLTLVADTIAHQKAHSNDVVDPWSTPQADNQQAFFTSGGEST
jgi:GTPase SAR1 family protein